MEIYERIKYLRKTVLNLSQEDFSKKIGLSRSNIGNIEVGRINITDRVIGDIVAQYNVNEEWLRNGTGEMFFEPDTFSLDEYIKSKGATDFELNLIKSYFDIPEELRNQIMDSFKNNILKNMLNDNMSASSDEVSSTNIDYEVESYRQELEAEQKGEILSVSEKPKGA